MPSGMIAKGLEEEFEILNNECEAEKVSCVLSVGGVAQAADVSQWVRSDSELQLVVTPAEGHAFNCWQGDVPRGQERAATLALTVRDDGVMLRDGRPFFPLGTFGARLTPQNGKDPDRLFSEFASNGFNCVFCPYSFREGEKCYYDSGDYKGPWSKDEMERYQAAARRHGVGLWVDPAPHSDYGSAQRMKEIVDSVRYYRDRPEVLLYAIADDTASHVTPDVLRNIHNVCHAIDDRRLTMQPDANDYEGRYEPYARSTDVFAQEIYPFRNAEHEPAGLSQVIKDCNFAFDGLKKSGMRDRSIWTIPQAFAGWGLWKKYPSRELVRAQTYLGIIHGCRGVEYYTYWSWSPGADGFAHNPKHTEELYSVTRELATIVDDLTSRDAKAQPTVEIVTGAAKDPDGFPSATCLLKDGADGKGPLLLAASSLVYGEPVTVKFRLGASKAETVFENGRAVEVKGGVLTDTFGPGEVHVYRLSK